MLGSPILYLKGMRIMMFQLSGYYYMGHSKFRKSADIWLRIAQIGQESPSTMENAPKRGEILT